MNKIGRLATLYKLGKPFLPSRDQRDLNDLEQAFGSVIDPLANIRNMFIQWSAQCDLELSNYKRTQQIRNFEREKNGVKKLLEQKKRPEYNILISKMQSALLALEIVEKTAIRNDVKPELVIPPGAVEVITVEKNQPYTALKRVESIFQNASGYVKIMDSWIGEHTLDYVWKIPISVPVFILTSTIEDKSKRKFEIGFKRLEKERLGTTEVKITQRSELHDRYIITQSELWHSGPSLKDLGVKKWGTVSKIGDSTTKQIIEKKFDDLWKSGKQLK
jgi:hypothetical protein